MKTISTPLIYPGGKSRAIIEILNLIPSDFKEYREPFIGGGSVYFSVKQKYPGRKYWINDLNYELYNFWKTCQEDTDSVVEGVLKWKNKFTNGKELFRHLRRNLRQLDDIELASAYYILNKITFSGCTLVGGFSKHSFENNLTESNIEKLNKIKTILDDTKITNVDYQKVIDASPVYEDKDVFIFLDPPYYSTTESGLYGKTNKWSNLHRTFDHYRFANAMKACKYKYLITYDDSQFIRRLFSFANIISWDLTYSMKSHGTGKELFISNYLDNVIDTRQDNIFNAWSRI